MLGVIEFSGLFDWIFLYNLAKWQPWKNQSYPSLKILQHFCRINRTNKVRLMQLKIEILQLKKKSVFNKVSSVVIINKNKLQLDNKKKQKVFADLMAKHNQLYKKWRIVDLASAILAILGLLVALAEFEIGFEVIDDESERDNINLFSNCCWIH